MDIEEIWKDVVGYEGRYQVSNLGRVISFVKYPEGKVMKVSVDKHSGHCLLNLTSLDCIMHRSYIHRLVAQAFIPNPYGYPMVLHIDGDPSNNVLSNLKWGTRSDNARDAVSHGTHYKTTGIKLTEDQVREIKSRTTGEYGENKRLAAEYGISPSQISDIKRGYSWSHVTV